MTTRRLDPEPSAFARFFFFTLLFLSACGSPARHGSTTTRDDLNREVAVPRSPRRIVTLAPNLTELLFSIGAGDRVIATDDFSNVPAAAARLRKVGGVQPSVELIIAAHPDLVIGSASAAHADLAAPLARASIPLYIARTDRIADVPRVAHNFSALSGVPAAAMIARLRSAAEAAPIPHRSRPRVLFLVWPEPLYVAGRKTFADDVIRLAGAENAVTSNGWPQYSLEAILESPPDLIVFPDRSVSPQILDRTFSSDARWRTLGVVKRRDWFAVDEDLFVRPGPRFPGAVKELGRIIDEWESRR